MSADTQVIKKGILLAGGSGSRLYPLTQVTNKHLLPIFNKPMIYYPLTALMLGGVREILIISSPHDIGKFKALFGDGSDWGMGFSYAEQAAPEGLAQAFIIGEKFIDGDSVCLNLGDHILIGDGLPERIQKATRRKGGASIFGHHTSMPERSGIVVLDKQGCAVDLEEKPQKPKSNIAVTGLYFYDANVVEIAKGLKPSLRGELEITDINKAYMERGDLNVDLLGRGYAWFDGGTPETMSAASQYVELIETVQGIRIACPEEVALRMGFIDETQFGKLIDKAGGSPYGAYLSSVLDDM